MPRLLYTSSLVTFLNPLHIFAVCSFEVYFNIILPSTCRSSKLLTSLNFPNNIFYILHNSQILATCAVHLVLLGLITLSCEKYQLWSSPLGLYQLLPASVTSSFLRKNRPGSLIWNILNPCLSPKVSCQTSHLYKTDTILDLRCIVTF
jgi:hypothetical protein